MRFCTLWACLAALHASHDHSYSATTSAPAPNRKAAHCAKRGLALPQRESQQLKAHITDCSLVYVDVGLNSGESLTSWYRTGPDADGAGVRDPIRPARFGKMPRHPLVFFGREPPAGAGIPSTLRQQACAVAFEPNPRYKARLENITQQLLDQGKRVLVYTNTAVTVDGGDVLFYTPDADNTVGSVDATTAKAGWLKVNVSSIAVAPFVCWLQAHFAHVALKIDVENLEFPIVKALLASGTLCSRSRMDLFIEYGFHAQVQPLLKQAQTKCQAMDYEESAANGTHQVASLRRWAR